MVPATAVKVATSEVFPLSAPSRTDWPVVEVGATGPAHAWISKSCDVLEVAVKVTVPPSVAVRLNHTSVLLLASLVIVE